MRGDMTLFSNEEVHGMQKDFFYRDTWAEVNLDHIYENVLSMKRLLPNDVQIIAVVKANAYGHGDVQVAKTALEAGASMLAVAFIDEALALRRKGVETPILVLGASRPEDVRIAADHNISLTVYRPDWLQKAMLNQEWTTPLNIHVKIDTGMGRLGIREQKELEEILDLIEQDKRWILEGAYTHFATADELDTSYFEMQYERFTQMIRLFPKRPRIIHCANSAAGLRFPHAVFNAVRMGIAMYGLTPSKEMKSLLPFPLKEAFSLHSRLVHVKQLSAGEKVSYGATYTAKEKEWIGTVPIGYADGWIRRLKDRHVLVEGQRVPIVGRICMDQLMVRLPKEMPIGTKVTLIGSQGDERITIDEIAETLETINYEIPCMISSRVPRMFYRNKSIMEVRNDI
jgi:alanine racemase